MKTIAIIYGGRSPEHEVSITSAININNEISKLNYKILLIKITKAGSFLLTKTVTTKNEGLKIEVKLGKGFYVNSKKLIINLCFILTHGTEGEDGKLQSLLDMMDLPYTGSKVLSSAICMSKGLTKTLAQTYISTVKGFSAKICPTIEQVKELGPKVFVKPENSGSSFGISLLENFSEIDILNAFNLANQYSKMVLFEKFIEKRLELDCGLFKVKEDVYVTRVGNITNTNGPLSYSKKYNKNSKAVFICPAPIDSKLEKEIQNKATLLFKVFDLEGFARIDFFFDLEDNQLYLNEINTIPGMTEKSHFPIMLKNSGVPFSDFLGAIIE